MQKLNFKLNPIWIFLLYQILIILFPEYKVIKVKKNGNISFKHHWWNIFSKQKVHFSELLYSEIPTRLSRYRYGRLNKQYEEQLRTVIRSDCPSCHIVEFLFRELNKGQITDTKLSRIIEDVRLQVKCNNFTQNSMFNTLNLIVKNLSYYDKCNNSIRNNQLSL
jgi:hypothetical protein